MSQAPLQHALSEALNARGVTQAQFSELMIRLLDHGVLCRSESKKEAELYDRYLQSPELVEDYLSVLHIRLHHERRFTSLRLFPPGAEIPGEADSDDGFNSGLRNRLINAFRSRRRQSCLIGSLNGCSRGCRRRLFSLFKSRH